MSYDRQHALDDEMAFARTGAARGAPGKEALDDELLLPEAAGEALPEPLRRKMETSLGADFSGVRVHRDGKAEGIDALAYAAGEHIHMADGQYDPHSAEGQRLLGHELAHVVQQREGGLTGPVAGHEAEADRLGDLAAAGAVATRGPSMAAPVQAKLVQAKKKGKSKKKAKKHTTPKKAMPPLMGLSDPFPPYLGESYVSLPITPSGDWPRPVIGQWADRAEKKMPLLEGYVEQVNKERGAFDQHVKAATFSLDPYFTKQGTLTKAAAKELKRLDGADAPLLDGLQDYQRKLEATESARSAIDIANSKIEAAGKAVEAAGHRVSAKGAEDEKSKKETRVHEVEAEVQERHDRVETILNAERRIKGVVEAVASTAKGEPGPAIDQMIDAAGYLMHHLARMTPAEAGELEMLRGDISQLLAKINSETGNALKADLAKAEQDLHTAVLEKKAACATYDAAMKDLHSVVLNSSYKENQAQGDLDGDEPGGEIPGFLGDVANAQTEVLQQRDELMITLDNYEALLIDPTFPWGEAGEILRIVNNDVEHMKAQRGEFDDEEAWDMEVERWMDTATSLKEFLGMVLDWLGVELSTTRRFRDEADSPAIYSLTNVAVKAAEGKLVGRPPKKGGGEA